MNMKRLVLIIFFSKRERSLIADGLESEAIIWNDNFKTKGVVQYKERYYELVALWSKLFKVSDFKDLK